MLSNAACLVMAGGQGTRFWPESTQKKPKQYLNLTGDLSLLQKTWRRIESLIPQEKRYLITVKSQESLAFDHSKNYLPLENIVYEPTGKNTAPCVLLALAKLQSHEENPHQLVSILAADHVILKEHEFLSDLTRAYRFAEQERKIVTIGIPPYFPHTGYGYIHRGGKYKNEEKIFTVKEFVEKPDFLTAQKYFTSGEYYWNACMFVSTVETLLNEYAQHSPEMFTYYSLWKEAYKVNDLALIEKTYKEVENISIDYAVMEKSTNMVVLPASFDWNDLGSWDALESVCDKIQNNVMVSKNNRFLFLESKGNIISTEQDKFVALIHMEDHIVISNPKCLIVLPKNEAQRIKEVVEFLKNSPEAYADLL